jgi:PHD/YefM family antitoxin component YafN of YafNO toxin-antitoxin module
MSIRTQSIRYVKANFAQVINDVGKGNGPIIVMQNGTAAAVIQAPGAYERTQQALTMMKLISMGMEDVARGRTYSHDEVFSSARKRLAASRKAKRLSIKRTDTLL